MKKCQTCDWNRTHGQATVVPGLRLAPFWLNVEIFPEQQSWPGQCNIGSRQSPVDIGSTKVTQAVYGMETLVRFYLRQIQIWHESLSQLRLYSRQILNFFASEFVTWSSCYLRWFISTEIFRLRRCTGSRNDPEQRSHGGLLGFKWSLVLSNSENYFLWVTECLDI